MILKESQGALPGWLNYNSTDGFWFMAQNGKGMTKVTVGAGAVLHLEPLGKSVMQGLRCEGGDVGMKMSIEQWEKAQYEIEEGEMGEGFSGFRDTPPMPEGPKH